MQSFDSRTLREFLRMHIGVKLCLLSEQDPQYTDVSLVAGVGDDNIPVTLVADANTNLSKEKYFDANLQSKNLGRPALSAPAVLCRPVVLQLANKACHVKVQTQG